MTKHLVFVCLALAGIILAIPTKNYLQKFKQFIKSFKFTKRVSWTFVLDALFWALFFLILQGAAKLVEAKTAVLSSQIKSATLEMTQQNMAAAQQLLSYLLIIFIIVILVTLVVYSIIKYGVWALLLKKKYTKKGVCKFFALNLLWWILWGALFYIFVLSSKDASAVLYLQTILDLKIVILVVLYIFMTTKLHYTYLKTNSIKQSFAKGIGSLVLIPKYLQAAGFAAIIYFVIMGITAILSQWLTATTGFYAQTALFVLFIVWLRYYLKNYIEEFKA